MSQISDIFTNQVLKGEKMENIGSGKTLASGPNDNVFVYFTDHGAKVSELKCSYTILNVFNFMTSMI